MITGKTIVIAALAATPVGAVAAAPLFDLNVIVAALIGATPATLLVLLEGWRIRASLNGAVTKLLTTNTAKATAEAKAEAAPELLKLTEEKATAEATVEAARAEQEHQDRAAKGVVIIKSRKVRKPKTKGKA